MLNPNQGNVSRNRALMGIIQSRRSKILLGKYIAYAEDMLYSDRMFSITIARGREA